MEIEDIPPTTLKPAPVMFAWEMLTAAEPVFVSINICDVLAPTATLPKLMLAVLGARVPAETEAADFEFPDGAPAPVTPVQPERANTANTAMRTVSEGSDARVFFRGTP
jgi:hypothetical protein